MSSQSYEDLLKVFQETENFPTVFIHKFIGKNSDAFLTGVSDWSASKKALYPSLKETHRRLSADNKHCSLTFEFTASSAEQIIDILKSTAAIPDLKMVL
ncbi:MAG: DUF493 domain-containing protein [Bdellovibrionales bacterium]|nr:DUF493 domain-containing protein [Bdellovibrionales bacterium]